MSQTQANSKNLVNAIYEAFQAINEHEREILADMVQGESPCCGGNVSLGHCESCGEPCDPINN